jgi:SAM-dependent methyltransferase
MAHPEQRAFCERVKALQRKFFPCAVPPARDGRSRWENRRVLDVGSLDINGNNRFLFTGGTYTGIDVGEGPNVDVVTLAHEFDAPAFDVIISTECFEHDAYYAKSIQNIVRLLTDGGLFLFTCATTGRPEHGTIRSDGGLNAPLLATDYYKNLTEKDIREVVDVDAVFEAYHFEICASTHDLYFWGVKR